MNHTCQCILVGGTYCGKPAVGYLEGSTNPDGRLYLCQEDWDDLTSDPGYLLHRGLSVPTFVVG